MAIFHIHIEQRVYDHASIIGYSNPSYLFSGKIPLSSIQEIAFLI